MKKTHRNKRSRGQALTELVAILIAICVVLLGMMLFSIVGVKGVRNIIDARETADTNLINRSSAGSGQYITNWTNISGKEGDGLQFTADDKISSGGAPDTSEFRKQLASTNGDLDVQTLAGSGKNERYEPFDLSPVQLFLSAADLTSGTSVVSDPIGDEKLYDIRRAFQRFGISTGFQIRDTVYMPLIPISDNP